MHTTASYYCENHEHEIVVEPAATLAERKYRTYTAEVAFEDEGYYDGGDHFTAPSWDSEECCRIVLWQYDEEGDQMNTVTLDEFTRKTLEEIEHYAREHAE